MLKFRLNVLASAVALLLAGKAHGQVIGSYDNFDCFNDTGQEAFGFEIDVEDVQPSDLTREFPSNFSATPWVIRYGLPTVVAYDWTSATPDAEHSFDAGHKGVLVTWAATWNGTNFVAQYGNQPFGNGVAGDGTPYVAHPTYTNGDSCWYYGLGNAYPSSGCDHFGISFAPGVVYGRLRYHWKVPDPTNPTQLKNAALEASIPPSPGLNLNPPAPAQPPVVHAVAEAPENAEPQWGDATWAKVTTLYGPNDAVLDDLQKANVKRAKTKKVVHWTLLQRPPAGQVGEKADVEDDAIPAGDVQVTKQYEYFKFSGAYDSETHQALCDIATSKIKLDAKKITKDCSKPIKGKYWVFDPINGDTRVTGNLGDYVGAHVNAYNVQ